MVSQLPSYLLLLIRRKIEIQQILRNLEHVKKFHLPPAVLHSPKSPPNRGIPVFPSGWFNIDGNFISIFQFNFLLFGEMAL